MLLCELYIKEASEEPQVNYYIRFCSFLLSLNQFSGETLTLSIDDIIRIPHIIREEIINIVLKLLGSSSLEFISQI